MDRKDVRDLQQSFMKTVAQWAHDNTKKLPEYLSSFDLVDLGFFRSHPCVKNANQLGNAPKYEKINGRCAYHRDDVMKWLTRRTINKLWRKKV